MLAKIDSSAVFGIDAYKTEVEVDIAVGLPAFNIVGLPDVAIQEARERVRAGISNSEYEFPLKRITVNLAPADVRKEGPSFDLPIAAGILVATGQLSPACVNDYLIIGELSLTGDIRRVNGVLSMALCAKSEGKKGIIIPQDNATEAALISGLEILPVKTLREVVDFLNNKISIPPVVGDANKLFSHTNIYDVDFQEVKGQEHAKRALEVAAAGGHNMLMVGPPGSGKTMLARRLVTIMPKMATDEVIEVTKLYSVAGRLPHSFSLITKRPFRAPHHTISQIGLIGGGQFPKPGEVSLSHHGILFLDEFPEFQKSALEVLRQPLEDGKVTISRALTSLTYPARFTLIAAMNSCPCGFFGDPVRECICLPHKVRQYRSKISGPLMDRLDIQIEVPRLSKNELLGSGNSETSKVIRDRVEEARERQRKRFKSEKSRIFCNAQMKPRQLKEHCRLSDSAEGFLENAVDKLGFSARAYDRIFKLGRTIADLAKKDSIELEHIAEAIQYRSMDRKPLY